MKNGTQAMLDAAKDDATLLPFETEFRCGKVRVKRYSWDDDDSVSVAFVGINDDDSEGSFCEYLSANCLLPAKKPKPKKWQNGTQAQLDAAKDDARLIPKCTFFISKRKEMFGVRCYRIPCVDNDESSVLMIDWPVEYSIGNDVNSMAWHHDASDLEPCND